MAWLASAVAAAAFALVLWGAFLLYRQLDAPIAVIGVDGSLERITPGEVRELVAANLDGGFLSLDLRRIQGDLEQHPWVESASVRRQWPDQVVIVIDEETPIARWGDKGFLNNRGRRLDIGLAEDLEHLPLLDGPGQSARRVMSRYRDVAQLLRPANLRIAEFRQGPRDTWQLRLEQGPAVVIGRGQVMAKLRRFLLVWERELADRAEDIAEVDIRYDNGVAVRWKDEADNA